MQSIPLMGKVSSTTFRFQRAIALRRLKSLLQAYVLLPSTEAQFFRQRLLAVVIAFVLAAILRMT
jgi:hypothetical protein